MGGDICFAYIVHFPPQAQTVFLISEVFILQTLLKCSINRYGSSHTKLGQWLILRVVVFEHILLIFISPT